MWLQVVGVMWLQAVGYAAFEQEKYREVLGGLLQAARLPTSAK